MGRLQDLSDEISSIVEKVRSYVVTVVVSRIELFSFLGPRIQGVGSGFIVGPGLAVTNSHVVSGASSVSIIYSDGSSGTGRVLARDPYRDLAIFEVDKDQGGYMPMGDSDVIRVGELVLAIGSPLGIPGPSVTLGVVSAVGRTIASEDLVLEDLIQTDAAINPGNSGGPLVSLRGEAVGVTTAMVPFAQGVGFAIPSNQVKRFLHMLAKYGRPVRAWIGVFVSPLTPEVAHSLGIGARKGALVVRVVPRSPASRWIREGDVIIRARGGEISGPRDLRRAVEDSIDEGEVELEILRGGRLFSARVPIVLEEL